MAVLPVSLGPDGAQPETDPIAAASDAASRALAKRDRVRERLLANAFAVRWSLQRNHLRALRPRRLPR